MSLLVLLLLILAKVFNYVRVKHFRIGVFAKSFTKFYALRYHPYDSRMMKRYRIISNVLNVFIYIGILVSILTWR